MNGIVDAIRADILALEEEADGMMRAVLDLAVAEIGPVSCKPVPVAGDDTRSTQETTRAEKTGPISRRQLMRPYPAYKDSGVEWIGEMPEGWKVCKLKRVTTFNYGDSLSSQERQDGEVPVYGSNGIVGTHNSAITKAPCIIVGRKGSYGKINFSEIPCFPIDTTYFVDASTTSRNLYWLAYLLPLLGLDEFSRDSAVPGLNREDAYAKIVPVPPLPEQRAIAAYLDRKTAQIDTLIANKRRRLALLAEERTARISHAVTKGLDPDAPLKDSGVEWIGEIPAGWEVASLRYTCNLVSGGTPDRNQADYWNGDIPWVKTGEVSFNIINEAEE